MDKLKEFGIIPIRFSSISSVLHTFNDPKNKVRALQESGKVIRLKKGLYVVSPLVTQKALSKNLISNHLYGPSYVSLESALSYYGFIPERTVVTYAITSKRKKLFSTSLGNFEYISVPSAYFPSGINQQTFSDQFVFLIASHEKALCDLIMTKTGLRLQSKKAMEKFLLEDIRLDIQSIPHWDLSIIEQCIETGYKKKELGLLKEYIRNEYNI